eukprot:COSAG01_NODE_15509_length_1329_cov_1.039837_2_plen_174_part_00
MRAASAKLLDDPAENLLAVSAFNDDGLRALVNDDVTDAGTMIRSDFFPGLGWMLSSAMWAELYPKWPEIYWDDWLRGPSNRKGRHILRPEISRTLHFGRRGTSNNQFGSMLDKIVLHTEPPKVDWASFDVQAVRFKVFDGRYKAAVKAAQRIRRIDQAQRKEQEYCANCHVVA